VVEAGCEAAGFAAIDALIALTILATTIGLALNASHTAWRVGVAAVEAREAETLMRRLIDEPAGSAFVSGQSNGMDWKVITEPEGAASFGNAQTLCQRRVELTGKGASGRHYTVATVAYCTAEGGAHE
jgi:hypothetical protein